MNTDTTNAFFLEEVNDLYNLDPNLLVTMGEEMYHEQIKTLVEQVLENKKIKIILLAGPSSSGKTTTSLLISKYLEKHNKKSLTVSLDDFFLDREDTPLLENGNYDYENVTAIDLKLFNNFIDSLLTKKKAYMPSYNFVTGKKDKTKTVVEYDDETYIIIEGLHALNPIIINQPKETLFKVYICALSNFNHNNLCLISYTDLRLMRRCIRDYYTRGRTIDQTIQGWNEVRDGERKYIDPFKDDVDFSIDSTHMYEPLIFAFDLQDKLSSSNQEKAQTLAEILSHCKKLPKSFIPATSLLNEFFKK